MKKELIQKVVEEVKKLEFHRNMISTNLEMLSLGLESALEGEELSEEATEEVVVGALDEIMIAATVIQEKVLDLRREIG